MPTTFDRHLEAIRSGTIERTNVIGLRKAINTGERQTHGWSVPKGFMGSGPAFQLEEAVENNTPKVTGSLHDTGLALLRSPRYRKRLGVYQDIISQIDHFKLVRFDRIGHRGAYAVPVYRAVAADGRSFTFRNIPWQSGGKGPEIVSTFG